MFLKLKLRSVVFWVWFQNIPETRPKHEEIIFFLSLCGPVDKAANKQTRAESDDGKSLIGKGKNKTNKDLNEEVIPQQP